MARTLASLALLLAPVAGDLTGTVAARRFSVLSPDPELLVWDAVADAGSGVTSLHGWLKAPLVHGAPAGESPHVCLRVSAHTRAEAPRLGPLLAHCGGPGTGRDCAMGTTLSLLEVADDFAFFGIDQRGVTPGLDVDFPGELMEMIDGLNLDDRTTITGAMLRNITRLYLEFQSNDGSPPPACPFAESNQEPVARFPTIRCDEIVGTLANLTYEEQVERIQETVADLTGVSHEAGLSTEELQILFAILHSGGLPVDQVHGVTARKEDYVRWLYRLVDLEQNLCVGAPRYRMKAPNGRAFNVLNFAGTVDFAKDIEVLRHAIRAPKISFTGYSYGTTVAPAYATLFPDRVERLVLDGVVAPEPDLIADLQVWMKGPSSVWQGIMTDCSQSVYQGFPEGERCSLAPRPSSKALHVIGDDADRLRSSVAAKAMRAAVYRIENAPAAVECVASLHDGNRAPDVYECMQFYFENSTALSEEPIAPREDRFGTSMVVAVHGLDYAGRLSEEAFVAWWRQSLEAFPFAALQMVEVAAACGSWPLYARPVVPAGDAHLRPLVIGNLHDAQTDYSGAQKMRAAYPRGALMTWQGFGHCLPDSSAVPADNATQLENDKALAACKENVVSYLATGALPMDGHVCMMDAPLSLGRRQVHD